jgi:hypothetical protein
MQWEKEAIFELRVDTPPSSYEEVQLAMAKYSSGIQACELYEGNSYDVVLTTPLSRFAVNVKARGIEQYFVRSGNC